MPTRCTTEPWARRMWPPIPEELRAPRPPDELIVKLGNNDDWIFEAAVSSHHTNPALFATHRISGQRAVVKLKLADLGEEEYSARRTMSIDRYGGHPEIAVYSGSVFHTQWEQCGWRTCPRAAWQLGIMNRLRRVPSPNSNLSR